MPFLSSTILGSSQPPCHSYFFSISLSGYKTGVRFFLKCNPSTLHAKPILEVPAGFPILSCARYKRKTESCLTTAAGLKTSFASHLTFVFCRGQKNSVVESGIKIGFTSSAFIKGNKAQLSFLFPMFFSSEEFLQQRPTMINEIKSEIRAM